MLVLTFVPQQTGSEHSDTLSLPHVRAGIIWILATLARAMVQLVSFPLSAHTWLLHQNLPSLRNYSLLHFILLSPTRNTYYSFHQVTPSAGSLNLSFHWTCPVFKATDPVPGKDTEWSKVPTSSHEKSQSAQSYASFPFLSIEALQSSDHWPNLQALGVKSECPGPHTPCPGPTNYGFFQGLTQRHQLPFLSQVSGTTTLRGTAAALSPALSGQEFQNLLAQHSYT